ncbi:bifunctional [glutamine synthetase] adenylyltransferase/[glutamine synthetase]-adenylyl-L-tyrosine phosphorylase [Rhodoblastus acidophilus]|uniref:Bifunctional glutamine synthetase adenylyltransferase/adenylyl-removing enzyme n=1 Tax=Candidatus Rhodoblastus alkanivorans TaxID=2954117 RepID=A0ABS9Z6N0_9HYPH|nr:bifunctional [glutamine synthetase] adenylyltransferase/[glutamine synthetase]-adenylyl-L-tyrosine phosphorylase [Candidatus Rhodoblastus alkanivorans]MCI4680270.1 bifunctional [glutamine synthetase] adenylyltransferase/[glutamine synthetase]-adenylyl-L-tyrosine phosphorylase [Candidatus Rhodoblastus alkanivorans]MCI4682741.1 bifunctional [glutamine synthetase] adenylyltransferase/[glutamine synthetase]-adenylyl-L-tyrosine phosphorylase [Candidatus Rhodoblastus alkanivorans]MDI4640048.1 bifun
MTTKALTIPRPVKLAAARARVAEVLKAAGEETAAALRALPDWSKLEAVLGGIADQSPFLWGLARRDPARLLRIRSLNPDAALDEALRRLSACHAPDCTEAHAMSLLRKAKQEIALIVALADLSGEWDVVAATKALSRAADRFVVAALRVALRLSGDRLALAHPDEPERDCGLVILALGKHGALELNYSSDVDLVVFYDSRSPVLGAGPGAKANSLRLTQHLVKLLQERTGDGYVLRVDLRLRPDPGSTAAAVSLDAARHYYETLGQNWERAAMIKARPVAGDLALGFDFLQEMAAFVWRKYFDYATIADIHAMKRQIHAAKGHAEIAVAGHDVKLGRGGIREIEFFVQTQQLIFGGRRKQLRGARTLDMLRQLCTDNWITQQAADDLSDAYHFLRAVEHRLQMVNDQQTQRLPEDEGALKNFARFCGYAGTAGFARDLLRHFRAVEKHYARLFEHAPGLDSLAGNLVFTGAADDPETLETLREMGFRDPALAAETVRGWHFGRRPAVRSARAREALTELVPALLEAFSNSGDADSGLAAFDAALARLPAATELFSLLRSHAAMLQLFADILGGAPRLAQVIARSPHVLDVAIDRGVMAAPMDVAEYVARLVLFHNAGPSLETFLDVVRDFGNEENFMIGLRLFAGLIEPDQAAQAYAALAEAIVRACLARVEMDFSAEHGVVPGGRCVVLGLGKLGSREMTATSDLDLVLLYDFDPERPESDGQKPLHATVYYIRLTQRLIAALTAPTRRGKLFEVDMRLRPSGRQGPLATQFASFRAYQASEAEIWEHMALTRARPIAGDDGLAATAAATIAQTLYRPRDTAGLAKAVRDTRALIAREKGDDDGWNLKLAAGGLLDVEFLAQFLALAHGAEAPALRQTATAHILAAAAKSGFLDAETSESLLKAHALYANVTQWLRLALGDGANPRHAAQGVKRRIAAATGLPDFGLLERELAATRKEVRRIFTQVLAKG